MDRKEILDLAIKNYQYLVTHQFISETERSKIIARFRKYAANNNLIIATSGFYTYTIEEAKQENCATQI
jgi:hypothetical protein